VTRKSKAVFDNWMRRLFWQAAYFFVGYEREFA